MRTLSLSVSILFVALSMITACSSSSDDDEGGSQAGSGGGAGSSGSSGGQDGGGSGTGGDGDGDPDGGVIDNGDGGMGGDGDGDGGEPVIVPLAELPDAFAAAVCESLIDCAGATKIRSQLGGEDCAERLAGELRAQDFAYMDQAIAAGHVLYDPAMLEACLDGVRAMGCSVATDTYPDPCGDVLAGNVPRGGECVVSAECQGTDFCAGRLSCPSTCAPLLGEGDECLGDEECGDDLLCLEGACATLGGLGDDCAGDTGVACALGMSCLGSTPSASGACELNTVIQGGALDEECDLAGILCQEGLSCVFDGDDAYHCEARVEAGAPCHLGAPGQCPPGQYCGTMSLTTESTCRPLPEEGDPCVLNRLCAVGLVCVTEGADDLCEPIRDNGGDCAADAACRSGHCVAGTCEPPPACQ